MSIIVVVNSTGNQLTANVDRSKIFLGDFWDRKGTFYSVNSTYSDITYPAGTVLGRIASSNRLVLYNKAATDGSQYVSGVLLHDITVMAGTTFNQTIRFVVKGQIAQEKIGFAVGTLITDVVENRTIEDRIGGDTVGILLITSVDNTRFDNN